MQECHQFSETEQSFNGRQPCCESEEVSDVVNKGQELGFNVPAPLLAPLKRFMMFTSVT